MRVERRSWALAIGIFVASAVALLSPAVFGHDPIYGYDSVLEKYFWRGWAFQRLAKGHIPVWCAGLVGGYPLISEPVVSFWYPPVALLHLLFPIGRALNLTWLAHLVWAQLGMWMLLREQRLRGSAALLGAVAYGASGWMVGHIPLGGLPHLATCAWTPWLVCSALRLGGRDRQVRPRDLAFMAVSVAGGTLAGHPQFLYASFVMLSIVLIGAWIDRSRGDPIHGAAPKPIATGFALGLATILGLAMAGMLLVPYVELVGTSNRGATLAAPYGFFGARLLPAQLLSMVAPTFFGDSVRTPYWGFPTQEAVTLYIGIVPTSLALMPGPRGARARAWALRALALLGVVLAFGNLTPLYGWLHDAVPLFGRTRHPARWLHLTAFAGAWLAALGLHEWLDRLEAARPRPPARDALRALAAPMAVIAVLGTALLWFGPATGGSSRFHRCIGAMLDESMLPQSHPLRLASPEATAEAWRVSSRALIRGLTYEIAALSIAVVGFATGQGRALGAALVGITLLDLVGYGRRYAIAFPDPRVSWTTEVAEELGTPDPAHRISSTLAGAHFPFPGEYANAHLGLSTIGQAAMHRGLLSGHASVQGVVGTTPREWLHLAVGDRAYDFGSVAVGPKSVLDLVATGTLLTDPGVRPVGEGWSSVDKTADTWLWRNDRALPRAFLVHACLNARSSEAALAALRSPDFDGRRAAIASGPCPSGIAALDRSHARDERVDWIRADDEALELEVQTSSGALLMLSDNLYPGWEARLDDRETRIHRVDLAMRGVVVPAGRHSVRFELRHTTLAAAATLAGFATALCGLLALLPPRRFPP